MVRELGVNMISTEEWEAQVAAATTAYVDGGSADVQADQDARETLATETVEVTLGEYPTEQEVVVKAIADADNLFGKAGPTKNWTSDMDENDLATGVDGLFLAERSKQTGEKYF